jgi:D-lyxose ketol-isomerase
VEKSTMKVTGKFGVKSFRIVGLILFTVIEKILKNSVHGNCKKTAKIVEQKS